MQNFESGFVYTALHKPTGEYWYLLGIDIEGNRVCAAGWPPSIGNLSDCDEFCQCDKLTADEVEYRAAKFGYRWL